MEVKIDIYDLAHQLNDENYNNLIVELFANANDDAHINLLKRMWRYVVDADKEEFIRHLNANHSENMSDELIQKTDERAEQYISETVFTFSAEHLTKQFLDNKENVKKAYIQGAWDIYTGKCNF